MSKMSEECFASDLMFYFAYGTTQQGFPHHRELLLGEPVARVTTRDPYAVVVPHAAACSNPGCRFMHRMAALVPGLPLHAEGDVFAIDAATLAALDALELSGPYTRTRITAGAYEAFAYPAAEPQRWRALVDAGRADALPTYPRGLATAETLKPCCVASPGHPGPHAVIDPLTPAR